MYELVELTIHKDFWELFSFLKNNKTRTFRNGDYLKLVYFKSAEIVVPPLSLKGVTLKIVEDVQESNWELVRDKKIAVIEQDLADILNLLSADELKKTRQSNPVCDSWFFERIIYGISEPSDAVLLVRYLFSHGYDFEAVTGVFSSLCKRVDLAKVFLNEMNIFYKEVAN